MEKTRQQELEAASHGASAVRKQSYEFWCSAHFLYLNSPGSKQGYGVEGTEVPGGVDMVGSLVTTPSLLKGKQIVHPFL